MAETLHYRRSHFVAKLPLKALYSPAHFWLLESPEEPGLWRVGLTRFATRMLGEMVDYGFEVKPGDPVTPGQILGWVEGFKAISDVYCAGDGTFEQENPVLARDLTRIDKDCHGAGWLFEMRGKPDARCMDVQAYRALLDKTIDKILENQEKGGDA